MPARTMTFGKHTKGRVKIDEPKSSIQAPLVSPRSGGQRHPSRRGSDYVLRQLLEDQHEQSSLQSILQGVTRTLACDELLKRDVGLLPVKDLKMLIVSAGLSHENCIEMSEIRERAREAQKLLMRQKKLREPTTPCREGKEDADQQQPASALDRVTGRPDAGPDSAPTCDEHSEPRSPRSPRTPHTPSTPRARPASASLAAQAERVVGALGTTPALAGLGSCTELQASAAGLRADVAAASSSKSTASTNKALRHALQLLESLTCALQEKGEAEAAAAANAAAAQAKAAEAAEAEAAAEAERARVEAEAAMAAVEAEHSRKAAAEAAAAAKAVTPLPLLQALVSKQEGAAAHYPAPLPLPPQHVMQQMQRHQQRMREGGWVSPRLAKQRQAPLPQPQQDRSSSSSRRKSQDGSSKRKSQDGSSMRRISVGSNGPCDESRTADERRVPPTRDVSVSFTVQASSAEL